MDFEVGDTVNFYPREPGLIFLKPRKGKITCTSEHDVWITDENGIIYSVTKRDIITQKAVLLDQNGNFQIECV